MIVTILCYLQRCIKRVEGCGTSPDSKCANLEGVPASSTENSIELPVDGCDVYLEEIKAT